MTELQKQKQRKENVLKLKKIGFWTLNIFSYICAFLFVLFLIISLASPKQTNNVSPRSPNRLIHNVNEVQLVDRNYLIDFDDSVQEIYLDSSELNNWSYPNLAYYLNSIPNSSLDDDYLFYESNTYGLEDYLINDYFSFFYSNNVISFDLSGNSNFAYSINGVDSSFSSQLCWKVDNSSVYNGLKSAFELDIQYNNSQISSNIFDTLSDVLTNFITTLNSGVEDVIELFWDSTNLQLTLLGN